MRRPAPMRRRRVVPPVEHAPPLCRCGRQAYRGGYCGLSCEVESMLAARPACDVPLPFSRPRGDPAADADRAYHGERSREDS